MKKAKFVRAALVDHSKIRLSYLNDYLPVVESYQTIKRHTLDGSNFIEVTLRDRKKKLIGKQFIAEVDSFI